MYGRWVARGETSGDGRVVRKVVMVMEDDDDEREVDVDGMEVKE